VEGGAMMYARPAKPDGGADSGVLLSGDHARMRVWREQEVRARREASGRFRAEEVRAGGARPLDGAHPPSPREENR
jgi:hypothetical protein